MLAGFENVPEVGANPSSQGGLARDKIESSSDMVGGSWDFLGPYFFAISLFAVAFIVPHSAACRSSSAASRL